MSDRINKHGMNGDNYFRYRKAGWTLACLVSISFGLFCMFAKPLHAQIDRLHEGEKVRIYAPSLSSSRIVGTVGELSQDTVKIVTEKSILPVSIKTIEELSISRDKKNNAGRGALIGASSGGVILGVAAVISNDLKNPCEPLPGYLCGSVEWRDSKNLLKEIFFGILGGAAAGALIGAAIPTERWEKKSLQVSVGQVSTIYHEPRISPTVSIRLSLM